MPHPTKPILKSKRDVEQVFSVKDFVSKLQRLAQALEHGKNFSIVIAKQRVVIPAGAQITIEHERAKNGAEELEFQLKWNPATPRQSALAPKLKAGEKEPSKQKTLKTPGKPGRPKKDADATVKRRPGRPPKSTAVNKKEPTPAPKPAVKRGRPAKATAPRRVGRPRKSAA